MEIINKILKYGREKQEQKYINRLIIQFYTNLEVLSNLDIKTFKLLTNNFLKEYDNLRFLDNNNVMFYMDKKGKYRKLTRKDKRNIGA